MDQSEMNHFGSGDNVYGNKIVYNFEQESLSPSIEIEAYIANLSKQHSKLQMLGFNRELDIEKIFITLTVSPENISGEKVSYDTCGISVEAPISELYLNRDKGTPYRLSMCSPIALHSILSHQKSVVLGEPGAGKTTLLKHLLLDVCSGRICSGMLPVFIKLSEISEFKAGCIKEFLKTQHPECFQLIDMALLAGNSIIFLDGFDEISPSQQTVISSEISILAAPQNKICLTCRTSVFPQNVLQSDFHIFECFGFSVPQRKRFVTNWFSADPVLAQKIKQEIFGDHNIFGLSRNPLLLSLMALEFEHSPSFRLPKKRIELYLGAIDILINKRELPFANEINNEVKKTLLQEIAYYLSNKGTDKLARHELVSLIRGWKETYESLGEDFANITVNNIVAWIIGTGIIVCDPSQQSFMPKQQFRFLHLTLQEALTAQYILIYSDPFQFITDNLGIPGKEETVRLVLSCIDEDTAHRVLDYCHTLQSIVNNDIRYSIVIGRYLSDISYSNHYYFNQVFDKLIGYMLSPPSAIDINDLIVSLASICGSNVDHLQYFSDSIHNKMQHVSIFVNYINVLKLAPSHFSSGELMRLLNDYSSSVNIRSELKTQIVGIIIAALEYTYSESLWLGLYHKYIEHYTYQRDSHLAGITTDVLGQVQVEQVKEIIVDRISQKQLELLDVAILYKYDDYHQNKQIILSSLERQVSDEISCFIAGTADYETQLTAESIDTILFNVNICPRKVAYLLCSNPFTESKNYEIINSAFFSYVSDDSYPSVLRCAAFECFLKVNKRDNIAMNKAIAILQSAKDENLLFVAIRGLSYLTSYTFVEGLLTIIQSITTSRNVLYSLLSFLSTHQIENYSILQWINENLSEWENDTELYMLGLLALARHHDFGIRRKLLGHLKKGMQAYETIAICKAVTNLNIEDAPSILLSVLMEQSDISIIGSIINMLGSLSFPEVEDSLLSLLDESRWPKKWPTSLPPLQRGEQRPTDLRRLNIISALGRRRSGKAYKKLLAIANDDSESDMIQKAARIAITNMNWESRLF